MAGYAKHPEIPSVFCTLKPSSQKRFVVEAKLSDSHASSGSGRCGLRGRWRCLELCVIGHHPIKTDADAFDNGEQDSTRYRAVSHRLVASSHGERAAGEESCDDGIPRVLLLPYSFDSAVVCVEKTSPDSEVTAEYGCAGFYRSKGTDASFAVRRVAEAFDTVPYCTTDSLM